jgi:hypothetical protein
MKQNRINGGWQGVFPDFRRVGVYVLAISMSLGDQGNGGGAQHQHDQAVPFARHQNHPPHTLQRVSG